MSIKLTARAMPTLFAVSSLKVQAQDILDELWQLYARPLRFVYDAVVVRCLITRPHYVEPSDVADCAGWVVVSVYVPQLFSRDLPMLKYVIDHGAKAVLPRRCAAIP